MCVVCVNSIFVSFPYGSHIIANATTSHCYLFIATYVMHYVQIQDSFTFLEKTKSFKVDLQHTKWSWLFFEIYYSDLK